MNTRSDNLSDLRVKGPARPPVVLHSEARSDVLPSELIRVKGPALPPVTLRSEPLTPTATVRLSLPLMSGDHGSRMFDTLHALVAKVNETEALFGRAGVWVDGERSGVQGGEIVIVLAPNDVADAVETCKRVADYLFAAARKTAGFTVKVFESEADAPVYELAA